MKKSKFYIVALLFVSLFGVAFMLTATKDYDPYAPLCYEGTNRKAKIQLVFPAGPNPFKNSGYEYQIPSPDWRYSDTPGGGWLTENDRYYCIVTVTSPTCSVWSWTRAMSSSNSTPGGSMNIELPPSGQTQNILVEYYERAESSSTEDFNKPVSGYPFSRIKFRAQQTFNGWPSLNIAQPILLSASQNIGVMYWNGLVEGQVNLESKSPQPRDCGINCLIENETRNP